MRPFLFSVHNSTPNLGDHVSRTATQSTERTTVHFYGIEGTDEVVHVSADRARNRKSFLIFVGTPGDEMREYPCDGVEEYADGKWYIRAQDPYAEQGTGSGIRTCLLFCPGSRSTTGPTWDDRALVALDPESYHINIVARKDYVARRLRGAMAIIPKTEVQPVEMAVAVAS